MKICTFCGIELSLSRFATNKTKKDGLQSQCRQCQKDYRKRHYEKNRQKYIDKADRWRKEQKIKLIAWLKTKSCVDCGNTDFRVFEFDHKDRSQKQFNISNQNGKISFDQLMKEIKKCDVVCANCHRIRTCEQMDYYKYAEMMFNG